MLGVTLKHDSLRVCEDLQALDRGAEGLGAGQEDWIGTRVSS